MPVEWTALDTRLLVPLDRSAGGLRTQLERALRDSIHSGRLRSGERLPPSRQVAVHLGISRGLVTDCYAQLTAEGYLTSRPGSPTRVAAAAGSAPPPKVAELAKPSPLTIDFRPSVPDLSRFPRRDWSWALTQACQTAPSSALDYGPPHGDPYLRVTLAGYLRRIRGAAADPANMVICGGFTQGLGLALGALAHAKIDRIGVEEPGPTYRDIVTARAGTFAVPVPVDAEGLDVAALHKTAVRAVVLTPAHQSPTGVVLTARRRHALLEWARTRDAMIIEDDYDAEFRYDRSPVGAMQGLAPDHVILLGTVSKSLGPALRLGWALAPGRLVAAIAAEKRFDDRTAPVLDQLALATLISSGRFDRHLRAMRKLYATRRQRLIDALKHHAPARQASGGGPPPQTSTISGTTSVPLAAVDVVPPVAEALRRVAGEALQADVPEPPRDRGDRRRVGIGNLSLDRNCAAGLAHRPTARYGLPQILVLGQPVEPFPQNGPHIAKRTQRDRDDPVIARLGCHGRDPSDDLRQRLQDQANAMEDGL